MKPVTVKVGVASSFARCHGEVLCGLIDVLRMQMLELNNRRLFLRHDTCSCAVMRILTWTEVYALIEEAQRWEENAGLMTRCTIQTGCA